MDERRVIERALAGEREAERKLYDAHVERVFRLAFRMAGEEVLARDLTQETFIRAFERLGQFRGDAAFSTWLHRVATSTILNGLRKVERIRGRTVDLEDAGARGVPGGDEPELPELRDRLETAIDALSDKYRLVVVMHDIEGYTHKEIADALGVATGTSKARLSRARATLRERLADVAEEYV